MAGIISLIILTTAWNEFSYTITHFFLFGINYLTVLSNVWFEFFFDRILSTNSTVAHIGTGQTLAAPLPPPPSFQEK